MNNWLEFIKGLIRPALVIAFAACFLWIITGIVPNFFTEDMANLAFKTFIDAILIIVGIWIGGRIAKPQ